MEILKTLLESVDIQGLIYNSAPVAVGALIALFWGKIEKVLKALNELADVLRVIAESLADKELTPEEMSKIKKEVGEAIAALKAIVKK